MEEVKPTKIIGVENLLIKQVSHEMQNATIYKHIAFICSVNGYLIAEKFFDKQANDEVGHSDLIMSYIKDRNFNFTYFSIPATTNIKFNTLSEAITLALGVEQNTTKLLTNIQITAEESKDRLTYNFMDKMLLEQIEEEALYKDAIAVAKGLSNDKYQQLQLEKYFEQFI